MSLRKRVLIIDDDKLTLAMVSDFLKANDFAVDAFDSGKKALLFLKDNKVDIVILDLLMPEMDGYEVLKTIRQNKELSSLPIIVLTGRCLQTEKIRALDGGADDYIVKPFDKNELLSRIKAVLRRKEPMPQKKSKGILITGGAGFIGSNLTKKLLATGNEIFVLDDYSTGSEDNLKDIKDNKNLTIIRGSITDDVIVSKFVDKCDLIYHLAATVGVKNVVDNPLETLMYDTFGTEFVLKYASANGAKVIITSTSEVYGKSTQTPFKEDADLVIGPPNISRWSYACSKLLDEFLAFSYHKERKLPFVVVRLFNVVGPGQTGKFGMVIPRLFKSALKNTPITIYGDGEQVRCFTDVDDIVALLIRLPDIKEADGEVINLGSENEISIKDLALKIKKLTGSSSPITIEPYTKYYGENFQDVKKRVPDLTKLRRITGGIPSTDLDTLLSKIFIYYKKHPEAIERI